MSYLAHWNDRCRQSFQPVDVFFMNNSVNYYHPFIFWVIGWERGGEKEGTWLLNLFHPTFRTSQVKAVLRVRGANKYKMCNLLVSSVTISLTLILVLGSVIKDESQCGYDVSFKNISVIHYLKMLIHLLLLLYTVLFIGCVKYFSASYKLQFVKTI